MEAAERLAALLAFGLRRIFAAAEADSADVTRFGAFRCDSADPAADLAALLALVLRSTLEAAVAARLPVVSVFFAIFFWLACESGCNNIEN